MKAPSPMTLRVLRFLAFSQASQPCRVPLQRRCYAVIPEREQPRSSKPPPRTIRTPARPAEPTYIDREEVPSSQPAPTPLSPPTTARKPPPPPPVFRPIPSGPDLRKKRDDSEDMTPQPLTRPIGMPNPPSPTDNMGLDRRTLRQRRDDFHNYEKHLARRAKMTKQISKPYFRDWSNMRFFKGKVFAAPERLFRADVSLWFPNFFGKTLVKGEARRSLEGGGNDGYGGLGRGTTEVLEGKVSVVSIVSNEWAQGQVNTFTSEEQNPDLHELLRREKDVAQRVHINYENNFLKWWILQLFAVRSLRRTRTPDEQARYFLVRRGVSDIMKEAIGLLNDKVGYVYLVDPGCRIRWAGSAEASPQERKSLTEGLRRLVKEARGLTEKSDSPSERKEKLEAAVADLTAEALVPDAEPVREKAAAGG